MFDLSGTKLVVIILAALIVLGPEELPGMLRRIGRVYGELKRLTDTVHDEIHRVVDDPTRELRETTELARTSLSDLAGTVRSTLTHPPPEPAITAGSPDPDPAHDTEPAVGATVAVWAPPLAPPGNHAVEPMPFARPGTEPVWPSPTSTSPAPPPERPHPGTSHRDVVDRREATASTGSR